MEGGPPMFRQDGSCPALLEDIAAGFPYGAVTRSGAPFQTLPVPNNHATGLVRVRSPLLAESRLMSFPPATEMFQFAGFASLAYGFSQGYPLRGGLPHSEIPGSPIARISPGLFAACHVLHRLSVPRHPPDALRFALERHTQRQEPSPPLPAAKATHKRRRNDLIVRCGKLSLPAEPALRRRRYPRGSFPGPPLKTLSGHTRMISTGLTPRGPRTVSRPRSHNSLLYNLPSTTPPASQ